MVQGHFLIAPGDISSFPTGRIGAFGLYFSTSYSNLRLKISIPNNRFFKSSGALPQGTAAEPVEGEPPRPAHKKVTPHLVMRGHFFRWPFPYVNTDFLVHSIQYHRKAHEQWAWLLKIRQDHGLPAPEPGRLRCQRHDVAFH